MLFRLKTKCYKNSLAQATTELAIMGAIIIVALSVLMQQGYLYNCKQALEMYTFRQALKLSRDGMYHESSGKKLPVGINLTVIRDIFVPSFFTGLNRQTLQATASVEYNPYIMYIPDQESWGKDLPTRQLLQVNDAMIRKGNFMEIPPTLLGVQRQGQRQDKVEYSWVPSNIAEMDFEGSRKTNYEYITRVWEKKAIGRGKSTKTITKTQKSTETIYGIIAFEDAKGIEEAYKKDDEEGTIQSVLVEAGTIPKQLNLTLAETASREKEDVSTIGD